MRDSTNMRLTRGRQQVQLTCRQNDQVTRTSRRRRQRKEQLKRLHWAAHLLMLVTEFVNDEKKDGQYAALHKILRQHGARRNDTCEKVTQTEAEPVTPEKLPEEDPGPEENPAPNRKHLPAPENVGAESPECVNQPVPERCTSSGMQ